MTWPAWRRPMSRSALLLLAALLIFGHVCELPALADVAHAHEPVHRSADHHADAEEVSCDAIDALQPSLGGCRAPGSSPAAIGAPSSAGETRSRVPAAVAPESKGPPRPLPLFLLHSSLLI